MRGVLVVIDAANVVGSVPDGWWRDAAGATERLRDALAAAGPKAVPGAHDDAELVLVVEGAARACVGFVTSFVASFVTGGGGDRPWCPCPLRGRRRSRPRAASAASAGHQPRGTAVGEVGAGGAASLTSTLPGTAGRRSRLRR